MSKIYFKLLHVVHHVEQSFDKKLHSAVKLFDFEWKEGFFNEIPFFFHSFNFFVDLRVFFCAFFQIFFFQSKQFESVFFADSEFQKLFGQLGLVIPSWHLESESLIIDLVEASVLQQSFKAVLYLEDVGLTFCELPLAELETDFLEVYVA